MYSISNHNFDISKLLLEKGADVNKTDKDGYSIISIAVDSSDNRMAICDLVLSYKPNIEVYFIYYVLYIMF